ncbi:MAG: putative toxin-antitoxin system toxin component, PIN family [Bacteroidota bacterium]
MAKKADRIIIDTNLWISFLITRDFKKLDEKINKRRIRIFFSLESIDEFLTVADRPKFRRYFSKADIEQLIDIFDVYGEVVEVKSKVEVCRDHKDNFLLSLSRDSQANYLITGDKDLLDLKTFEGTKIIKMSDYLKKIE